MNEWEGGAVRSGHSLTGRLAALYTRILSVTDINFFS